MAAHGEAQTVLVVDDDPAFLRDLRDLLRAFLPHLEVLVASSGREGLEVMAKRSVDLLITDQTMPGMDGLELLESARQKYPQVPRIMVTGFPHFDLALAAVNDERVIDFIQKPPNAERTIAAVQRALAQRTMDLEGKGRAG
jgi:DNA-binding NtrC family response regulator